MLRLVSLTLSISQQILIDTIVFWCKDLAVDKKVDNCLLSWSLHEERQTVSTLYIQT